MKTFMYVVSGLNLGIAGMDIALGFYSLGIGALCMAGVCYISATLRK